jgi:tetratricopeptide (TPR) repeat protein
LPVGWLWYLGTLVPVIGLVQVGAQSMADRYTYLPQIGLFVVIVWTARETAVRIPRGRAAAAAAAVAIIAGAAALAYRQTSHWRDSQTLWSYTVGVMPGNAVAQSALGAALLESGDTAAARDHLEAALRIQLMHRPALLNLAKLDVLEGDLDAALLRCQLLVSLRADDPAAHTTWSSILIRESRPQEALDHIEIALAANPDFADALVNRAAALLLLGRPGDALASAERATRLAPDDAAAFTNLASASLALGRTEDARRYCAHALELDPAYAPARTLRRDLDALPE